MVEWTEGLEGYVFARFAGQLVVVSNLSYSDGYRIVNLSARPPVTGPYPTLEAAKTMAVLMYGDKS